mgnify:CR=1 FL=1
MIAATAAISANSGSGWVMPMTILLTIILVILSFTMLTGREDSARGSTPLSVKSEGSIENIEGHAEDLPDPLETGFDLPLM